MIFTSLKIFKPISDPSESHVSNNKEWRVIVPRNHQWRGNLLSPDYSSEPRPRHLHPLLTHWLSRPVVRSHSICSYVRYVVNYANTYEYVTSSATCCCRRRPVLGTPPPTLLGVIHRYILTLLLLDFWSSYASGIAIQGYAYSRGLLCVLHTSHVCLESD